MAQEVLRGKLISGMAAYDQAKHPPKDTSLIADRIRRESELLEGLGVLDVLHSIAEISRSGVGDARQFQTLLRSSLDVNMPLSVYDSATKDAPGDHRILGLMTDDEAVVLAIGGTDKYRVPYVEIARRYDESMPLLRAYWHTLQGQIGPLSQDHPYMRIIKDDLVKDGAIAFIRQGWSNSDQVVNGIISFLGTKSVSLNTRLEVASLVLAFDKYPMRGVDPHHDIFEKFDQDLA